MPRRSQYVPLRVLLNGRLVGYLEKEPGGLIKFRYDKDWLAWEHALPVSLSMPLHESGFRGEPVVAVFENLLPDSDALRRRIAETVGARGTDAYGLLAAGRVEPAEGLDQHQHVRVVHQSGRQLNPLLVAL